MNRKKIALLVLFMALALRSLYGIALGNEIKFVDGFLYNELALNIVNGKGFVFEDFYSYRAPGYPFFIAMLYMFTKKVFVVRIAQAFISAITCYLIYKISFYIYKNEIVALLSLLFLTFYPFSIYYSGALASETIYTFLIALSTYLTLKAKTTMDWTKTGIVFGLSSLVKPTTLIFLVLIGVWIFLKYKRNAFKPLLTLLILFLLALSPWILRNYAVHNSFVPISANGGLNLWVANNPSIDDEGIGKIYMEHRRNPMHLSEVELDKYYYGKAIGFIKENPGLLVKRAVNKFLLFWRPYPNATLPFRILSILSFGVALPFAFYGILNSGKYWKDCLLLLFLLLSFSLSAMIFLPLIRYRNPVDPYVLIFAAHGAYLLFKKISCKYL